MSAAQKQEQSEKIKGMHADIMHIGEKTEEAEKILLQTIFQEYSSKVQLIVGEIISTETIGSLLDSKFTLFVARDFDTTPKVTEKLSQSN